MMEMALKNGFCEISQNELVSVEGGLLGVAWLTWGFLGKVFGGAVTLGAAGATTYFATK